MAIQEPLTVVPSNDDKHRDISHVETPDDDQFQKLPKIEKVDEFGAHAKTDPKEIALVKKLDFYMLVCLLHSPFILWPRPTINPSPFSGSCTFSTSSTAMP